MDPVIPLSSQLAQLAALSGVGNLFDGAKVGLYKAVNNLGPNVALADVTPCDFTGYALSAAVVWHAPLINTDGLAMLYSDLKSFISTGAFLISNTVMGYYVVDSAGTNLLWVEPFANPPIVAQAGVIVPVVASLRGFRVAA